MTLFKGCPTFVFISILNGHFPISFYALSLQLCPSVRYQGSLDGQIGSLGAFRIRVKVRWLSP